MPFGSVFNLDRGMSVGQLHWPEAASFELGTSETVNTCIWAMSGTGARVHASNHPISFAYPSGTLPDGYAKDCPVVRAKIKAGAERQKCQAGL